MALGASTRNATTARRSCASSTRTSTAAPWSSGDSKWLRSTDCAADPTAYTVGRDISYLSLSAVFEPWDEPWACCPATAAAAHSIFWEVVRSVRWSTVIDLLLWMTSLCHLESSHGHRPTASLLIPSSTCPPLSFVKQDDQSPHRRDDRGEKRCTSICCGTFGLRRRWPGAWCSPSPLASQSSSAR